MQMLMEKVMEQVKKERLTTFTKHLPIGDPSLGLKFLRQIHIHYHMNFDP